MFQHLFTYLAVFICTLNTAYSIGDSFFGSYEGRTRVIPSHTTFSRLSHYETRQDMETRLTGEIEKLQQEIATLKHSHQHMRAQEQEKHQQIVHTLQQEIATLKHSHQRMRAQEQEEHQQIVRTLQALLMACRPQESRISRMLIFARKNPTPEDQPLLSFAGNVGNAEVSALLDEALHEEGQAYQGSLTISAQEESCHGETQANLTNTAHKDLLAANIKEALKETS